MKVAKVQDIANLADGSVIGQITAQVKAAFPPKVGEGKYGPWRVQACILKDATGEIRASFWIPDDMKDLVGQTITIKSQATNKGLQGIAVQYSKHSESNELKITEKAAIGDQAANAIDEYTAAVTTNTAAAKAPHAALAANPTVARKRLFQQAQLYSECLKAANYIRDQHKMTDDHFQAAVASMYISADRAGLFACFPDSTAKPKEDEIPMSHGDELAEDLGW